MRYSKKGGKYVMVLLEAFCVCSIQGLLLEPPINCKIKDSMTIAQVTCKICNIQDVSFSFIPP